MRPARPIFVEETFRRVFGRRVQIVIDATRFFAGRRDEADQSFSQFRFLARPGLKRGDDSYGLCVHNDLCLFVSVGG